jgi:hypothetical protein
MALDHLHDDQGRRIARLYRIFVYDAPPAIWDRDLAHQLSPEAARHAQSGAQIG